MLEICGAVFIIVMGTLAHFLYDWTGHNKIVGYFTAVNESTWEHLKLLVAPSLVWMIVELHFYHDNLNFLLAKFLGLATMLLVVPIIFYAYTHFTKKSILVVDIASFVLAVGLGQMVFWLVINMNYTNLILTHVGAVGMIAIGFFYITRTYVPDKNFLEKDPITKRYGILKKK